MTMPYRRQAMTLLEVVISMAIFSLMMSLVCQSLVSGVKLQETMTGSSDIDDTGNRVLQKIAGYLRTADYNYIYTLEQSNGNTTYRFNLCTGLDRNGPIISKKAMVLYYQKVERKVTAILYDRTNAISETDLGVKLQEIVATNLTATDGLKVEQLGVDSTYVKGNRLKITLSLTDTLRDGTVLTKAATTTIYLRSTMHFRDALLSSATGGTSIMPTPGGTPTNPNVSTEVVDVDTTVANSAKITLGPDTDSSTNTLNGGNNVIIVISAALQTTAHQNTVLSSMTVTATGGAGNALTVTDLGNWSYKVTGTTVGAATVNVTVTSNKNGATFTNTATRLY